MKNQKEVKEEKEIPCQYLKIDLRSDRFFCTAGGFVTDIMDCFELTGYTPACLHRDLAKKV